MIERPSPNFDERRNGVGQSLIVFHYTGMKTAAEALGMRGVPLERRDGY